MADALYERFGRAWKRSRTGQQLIEQDANCKYVSPVIDRSAQELFG
jgi:hypothetical protein